MPLSDILPLHHLIDFGMAIILWMVQLVIYPSFLVVEKAKLVQWHKKYTFRVSCIIAPIMLSQMGMLLLFNLKHPTWISACALVLVSICWILTFSVSIPLHRKVEKGEGSEAVLNRLVWTNWPRTCLWSLVCALGFFY